MAKTNILVWHENALLLWIVTKSKTYKSDFDERISIFCHKCWALKDQNAWKYSRKEVPFVCNAILCKYEKPQHFLSWKCSFIYLYHVVNITLTYHWTGLIYFFYATSMVMGQLFIVCSLQVTGNLQQTNTMTLYSKTSLLKF